MPEIDEVKKILDKHEKRISDLEKIFKSKPILNSISGEEVIGDLINSGFFDIKKKLGEIKKELKIQAKFEKGIDYLKILEKLTRENKLTRKMVGHQWMYRKKNE